MWLLAAGGAGGACKKPMRLVEPQQRPCSVHSPHRAVPQHTHVVFWGKIHNSALMAMAVCNALLLC